MAAEAVIRFAAMLAAAMTIVAVPASAQTNDPNPDQTKIDCRDGTNAAGADCAKD
ncbi:peptidase S8, partial [Mesorhizobium sp. M7A.F.Ca.US.003.02.1.1]